MKLRRYVNSARKITVRRYAVSCYVFMQLINFSCAARLKRKHLFISILHVCKIAINLPMTVACASRAFIHCKLSQRAGLIANFFNINLSSRHAKPSTSIK